MNTFDKSNEHQNNHISLMQNCSNSIPLISFIQKTDNISVQITCGRCLLSNTLDIDDYVQLIKSFIIPNCYYSYKHTDSFLNGNHYCFDCREWLCPLGFVKHKSSFKLVNHILLSNEPQFISHCLKHKKKKMKYLCPDCCELLCHKCFDNHNPCHSLINLDIHIIFLHNKNSMII